LFPWWRGEPVGQRYCQFPKVEPIVHVFLLYRCAQHLAFLQINCWFNRFYIGSNWELFIAKMQIGAGIFPYSSFVSWKSMCLYNLNYNVSSILSIHLFSLIHGKIAAIVLYSRSVREMAFSEACCEARLLHFLLQFRHQPILLLVSWCWTIITVVARRPLPVSQLSGPAISYYLRRSALCLEYYICVHCRCKKFRLLLL
jgi:hypothetical protein